MEFLIIILKKVELVDELIVKLQEIDIHHGTIMDAKSMTSALAKRWTDVPMFGLFRSANNHEYNEDCKMLMFVLDRERIDKVTATVEEVVGDLNQPGTAVMFTVPVNFEKGFDRN
ncbi:MAG: hypothetical protein E7254_07790 [Lachnospiraceae bacterium]|nr:hypothetical protein [Lachnospiraceae bacterium]